MENITIYIGQIEAILAAVVALVIFGIASWKQIQAAWERKEAAAKVELSNVVTGLITKAETKPNEILQSLTDLSKEKFPAILSSTPTPELKQSLVLTAIQEKNPGLLKKAQLKDVPAILSFIGNVYQGAKPLVSLLRKK